MKKIILFLLVSFYYTNSFAQLDTTYQGKEFWVGYGHHQFMEPGQSNGMDMTLYLSTDSLPATVTVTLYGVGTLNLPATQWIRTYNIPAYTSISTATTTATSFTTGAGSVGAMPKTGVFDCRLISDLPPTGSGSSGLFVKKGIQITSNVPISAFAHIYGSAASGATMLLPVEAWGTNYVSMNSSQSYASNCFNWVYIIAKEDNTMINLKTLVKVRGQNSIGLQPDIIKTITLQKGQIYQILGANTGSDINGSGGGASTGFELTGTIVKSIPNANGVTQPIAVFSGSSRTSNPATCGSGGGDNEIVQMFPLHMWGKQYLTTPFSGSSVTSTFSTSAFKIAVADPATIVRRNGTILTGLQAGNIYKYESNTADYIEADKPILVTQFMLGGNCASGNLGDPDMVVLSPIEQAVKRSLFYRTSVENITVGFLSLVVPTAGLSSLTIDGSTVFDYTISHPNKAGYTIVVKRWSGTGGASGTNKGQVLVRCDSSFTAITYGLGSVESYVYNAGGRFKVTNTDTLNLASISLPALLENITAIQKNNDVIVSWKTTDEINVDQFVVERSLDGNEFSFAGSVNATNRSTAFYNYNDHSIISTSTNILYYRIKTVDKDGKFAYSRVVAVKVSSKNEFAIVAIPNPFKDELQIKVQSNKIDNIQFTIQDISGRVVASKKGLLKQGLNNFSFTELRHLPNGIYSLIAQFGNEQQIIKVVK